MDESQKKKKGAELKKPDAKQYILHDFILCGVLKQAKLILVGKNRLAVSFIVGGDKVLIGKEMWEFSGEKVMLYILIWAWGIQMHAFIEATNIYSIVYKIYLQGEKQNIKAKLIIGILNYLGEM